MDMVVCASFEELRELEMDQSLSIFRKPTEQYKALLEISRDGCVTIAYEHQTIIAYVTFHKPGRGESWAEDVTGELIELGAVEVSTDYRGQGLAEKVLKATFDSGRFDHTIVFATMYFWHYDLKRTGLSDFAYKRLLDKLYRKAGLMPFATTDPEIRSGAANQLMARIGPDTSEQIKAEFERLRLKPVLDLY